MRKFKKQPHFTQRGEKMTQLLTPEMMEVKRERTNIFKVMRKRSQPGLGKEQDGGREISTDFSSVRTLI